MSEVALGINPVIDRKSAREFYDRFGWIQVHDLLNPESADMLENILATSTPWELVLHQKDAPPRRITQAEFRNLSPEAANKLVGETVMRAGWEFSYIYMTYQIIQAYLEKRDEGHPLHQLAEFMNSAEMIDLMREITGHDDVVKVDAQATLYRPGDFLALHDDADQPYRRAAYTLGMTRNWRGDWGGQLLMHSPNMDIIRGLLPRFNTLTIFKVPLRHSVAQVSSYAQRGRFSITGWMRTDAPE